MQSYVALSPYQQEARTHLRRFFRELLISLVATLIAGALYAWQPGFKAPTIFAAPAPPYQMGWGDGGYTNCQISPGSRGSYASRTVRSHCG